MDIRKIKAIEKQNKERILKACPNCPETSGIYFLTREENGFKFAYIGQAKNLLTRLAGHLKGYQYIDLSIKKHGLFDGEINTVGWRVNFLEYPISELDEMEQYYIKKYACAGYQMRNKTAGGQGNGKTGLDNSKPKKNYYDGLDKGYANAQKFVKNLFDKHLIYMKKSDKPNKNQEKAMQKFKEFLELESEY